MEDDKTVLVVGAHPDDYEIGAGMSILSEKEKGNKVISVVCSSGEVGGNPTTRQKEAENAAKILGIDDLIFLSYKDTSFPEMVQIIDDLKNISSKVNPYLVMTHADHDTHQDHVAVAEASMAAFKKVPQVLLYRGSFPKKEFLPNIFVMGNGEMLEKKIEAISAHKSQSQKIHPDYIRATAIFFGSLINGDNSIISYAEPFISNHYIRG